MEKDLRGSWGSLVNKHSKLTAAEALRKQQEEKQRLERRNSLLQRMYEGIDKAADYQIDPESK